MRLQGMRDAVAERRRRPPSVRANGDASTRRRWHAFEHGPTIRRVAPMLELAEREVLPKLLRDRGRDPRCSAACTAPRGRRARPAPHPRARSTCSRPGATCTASTRARCRRDLAYETGTKLADALLAQRRRAARRRSGSSSGARRRCARRATTRARSSRCSASGRAGTPRRGGSTGLEVISLEELGRPRIDVTVRISGFFRDAFPHLVELLDEAVTLVAGLDEPVEQNFVRKHVLADVEELAGDWRARDRAHLRRAPGHLRDRHPAARGRQELARRRRPGRGLRGLGRPRLRPRARTAARRAAPCAASSRASTSRSRTSTRASTTCSTPATTSPSTAG